MNFTLRPALIVAALSTLPLLTGCQSVGQVRTVTQSDNGTTITLSHHDRLEVQLPGNPTTGHSWQTVKLNSWVIAPLGRPSFKSDASDAGTHGTPRVGAGGTFVLIYDAVGIGTSPLELAYSRPWEPETATGQTFKITVNVSK